MAKQGEKCQLPWCGHALSMHNESGYCRSRTTPDRQGECICDGTPEPSRVYGISQGGPFRG